MEFGIALNQLTQATVVSADRTIKLWPVALFICALYPCLSSGLMFVAQKRKSLFYLVAIGMALIPSLLLFLAFVSLLIPW